MSALPLPLLAVLGGLGGSLAGSLLFNRDSGGAPPEPARPAVRPSQPTVLGGGPGVRRGAPTGVTTSPGGALPTGRRRRPGPPTALGGL